MLGGMPGTLTTIKVPKALRERIAARAGRRRMTAAEVIAELLDEADRRSRFTAVREAYATTDASYREETDEWDSLADDGLRP
jgi:predicted DNA-binding ribbon-helix-helix protein